MSDLCCKPVSIRINPSGFIDCATEDPIWVEGQTDVNAAAYASSIGYLLTLRRALDDSETFLTRYNEANNTMTDVGSVLQYVRSNLVYDESDDKFVFASADTIYTFDAVSGLVNNPTLILDPIGLVTTDAIKFLYVPQKSKTYGQFQVLGQWYMGAIDLTAGTLTMLGLLSTFWSNLTYSPITDCIYGTTGGNSLKKFSLNTNSENTVAAVTAEDCGWDTDRDLLVCFGTVITEVNTATEVATVTNDGTTAWFNPTKHPVYCSSIHKFFVVGRSVYDTMYTVIHPTPYYDYNERSVYWYDTETKMVQDAYHDFGYWGVFPIDDTVMLAAVYAIDENDEASGSQGFRKLCVHGFIEPWMYFKADEPDAGGFMEENEFAAEERNEVGIISWHQSSHVPCPLTFGQIGNCWESDQVDGLMGSMSSSTYTDRRLNWLFEKDWTLRFWVRMPDVSDRTFGPTQIAHNYSHLFIDYNMEVQDDPDPPIPLQYGIYWWDDANLTSTYGIVIDTGGRSTLWSRIVIWHKAGVQFGVKYNNQASQTVPIITSPKRDFAYLYFLGAFTEDGPQWDEICLMKGIVWDEAEMLEDWNDGLGRTWSKETGWEAILPPEE